jgi:hypothetical protein
VLVTSASFTATEAQPYGLIVVPAGAELVLADEAITLHVEELRVHGKLLVGSPSCRLTGPIDFVFHGSKPNGTQPTVGEGNTTSKGLLVLGGSADVFGTRVFPTWTRLATTAFAGDEWIELQHNVSGWTVGTEVLVTTTVYEDRPEFEPQNEV